MEAASARKSSKSINAGKSVSEAEEKIDPHSDENSNSEQYDSYLRDSALMDRHPMACYTLARTLPKDHKDYHWCIEILKSAADPNGGCYDANASKLLKLLSTIKVTNSLIEIFTIKFKSSLDPSLAYKLVSLYSELGNREKASYWQDVAANSPLCFPLLTTYLSKNLGKCSLVYEFYLRNAADNGNSIAQYEMAMFCEEYGTKEDYDYYLRKSALGRYPKACYTYAQTLPLDHKDYNWCMEILKSEADSNDDCYAQASNRLDLFSTSRPQINKSTLKSQS
jgi:hypothetical protein